jgi:hypothetical protein
MTDPADTVAITVHVPRHAFAPAAQEQTLPDYLSGKTAERILSVPARTFAEHRRRPDFWPEVLVVGKLRLVRRTEYIAWLREQSERRTAPPEPRDAVDELAAELGLRVVGGGGR